MNLCPSHKFEAWTKLAEAEDVLIAPSDKRLLLWHLSEKLHTVIVIYDFGNKAWL